MGALSNRRAFAICLVSAVSVFGSAVAYGAGLTLEDAVSLAMKNSPEAVSREENFTKAKLNFENAKAGYRPGLFVNGKATANKVNAEVIDKNAEGTLNFSVPFGHLLGTGGFFGNGSAKAFAEVRMSWDEAQSEYMASGRNIANGVRSRYFRLLKARSAYRFAADSVDRLERVTLPDVKTRKVKGAASEADVIRTEAALASARIQARKSAREVSEAEVDLCRSLGLEKIQDLNGVTVDEAMVKQLLAIQPAQAVVAVGSRRTDTLRSANSVKKVDMAVNLAKSELLPNIGLQVSAEAPTSKDKPKFGLSAGLNAGTPANILSLGLGGKAPTTRDWVSWSTTLSVSYPIFDIASNLRDVRLRELEKAQAVRAVEDTAKAVAKEIASAQANLQDAYDLWSIAALNLKAEELAFKTAKAKFDAGLLSQVGLDDAGSKLSEAKVRLEQAGYDVVMACHSMKASLGE